MLLGKKWQTIRRDKAKFSSREKCEQFHRKRFVKSKFYDALACEEDKSLFEQTLRFFQKPEYLPIRQRVFNALGRRVEFLLQFTLKHGFELIAV